MTHSKTVLYLDPGISASDITVSRTSNNLYLKLAGSTDWIKVDYYFDGEGHSRYGGVNIEFANGEVWDVTMVKQMLTPVRMFSAGASSVEPMAAMQIDSLVSAMASFAPAVAGVSDISVGQQIFVTPLLAASAA